MHSTIFFRVSKDGVRWSKVSHKSLACKQPEKLETVTDWFIFAREIITEVAARGEENVHVVRYQRPKRAGKKRSKKKTE